MAIIVPPVGLVFQKFRIGEKNYDYNEVSESTGAVTGRPQGNQRWTLSIESQAKMGSVQAALWVPMALKMKGRLNHLAMWDVVKPVPVGTMRGSLTLLNSIAIGDSSAVVTGGVGQANTTLKALDWLQFGSGLGSQLVAITDDATANASGQIAVNFVHQARVAFPAGTVVTWDKPVAYYKSMGGQVGWEYDPGYLTTSGVVLDLLEQWQ